MRRQIVAAENIVQIIGVLNQLPANTCSNLYLKVKKLQRAGAGDEPGAATTQLNDLIERLPISDENKAVLKNDNYSDLIQAVKSEGFSTSLYERFKTELIHIGGFDESHYEPHLTIFQNLDIRNKLEWLHNTNLLVEATKRNDLSFVGENVSNESLNALFKMNIKLNSLRNIHNAPLAGIIAGIHDLEGLTEEQIGKINNKLYQAIPSSEDATISDEQFRGLMQSIASILPLNEEQKAYFLDRCVTGESSAAASSSSSEEEEGDKIKNEILSNRNIHQLEQLSPIESEKAILKELKERLLAMSKKQDICSGDLFILINVLRNADDYNDFVNKIQPIAEKFIPPEQIINRGFFARFKPKLTKKTSADLIDEQKNRFDFDKITNEANERFEQKSVAPGLKLAAALRSGDRSDVAKYKTELDKFIDELQWVVDGIDEEIEFYNNLKLIILAEESQTPENIDARLTERHEKREKFFNKLTELQEIKSNFSGSPKRARAFPGFNIQVTVRSNETELSSPSNLEAPEDEGQASVQSHVQDQDETTTWTLHEINPGETCTFEVSPKSESGVEVPPQNKGIFTESIGERKKKGHIPLRLTVDQFPAGDEKDKIRFAMYFAAQTMTDLNRTPSKERPLYLLGKNPEAVRYIWTAMIALGRQSKHHRFDENSIRTMCAPEVFDPSKERASFFRFSSSSLYATQFRNNKDEYADIIQNFDRFEESKKNAKKQIKDPSTLLNKKNMTETYRSQLNKVKERKEEKENLPSGSGFQP